MDKKTVLKTIVTALAIIVAFVVIRAVLITIF